MKIEMKNSDKKPFFSIVIPTRDRPEFINLNLQALKMQTFLDFEVIVSDNPVNQNCRSEFDKNNDRRYRYVKAPKPLGMSDNWENGLLYATGKYIMYLEDKTFLYVDALEKIKKAIDLTQSDIIGFSMDKYIFRDEKKSFPRGMLIKERCSKDQFFVTEYDAEKELKDRLEFRSGYGDPEEGHCRGTILTGVYSKTLIDAVRRCCGRLFFGFIPDYAAVLPALALTRKVVQINDNILFICESTKSTGKQVGEQYQKMVEFTEGTFNGYSYLKDAPIRNFVTGNCNKIAGDYERGLKMLIREGYLSENDWHIRASNLCAWAYFEYTRVNYPDINIQSQEYSRLMSTVNDMSDFEQNQFKNMVRKIRGNLKLRLKHYLCGMLPETWAYWMRKQSNRCKRIVIEAGSVLDVLDC